jgi:purine-binding chemotaxis protein CheW
MNLAEIRKKAQKEKNIEKLSSVPDGLPVEKEAEGEFPVREYPVLEEAVPAGPAESLPCAISVSPPEIFDPVAVMVAGRETAGYAGEMGHVTEAPVSADAAVVRKYLCFRVASEDYAVNLMDIKEIIKPREITEVPHAPAFVKGIISLRGIIIPILDMRLRLGFPPAQASSRERFIIVKKGEGFCGLLVDEVYQVINLDQQPIERPPAVLEGTDREFVSGIGRRDESIYILMDLEKVLDIALP